MNSEGSSEQQVRTVEVDRISNNGNAIAEPPGKHLNLGNLKKSVVGETVEVELNWMNKSRFARCLDEEYIKDEQTYRISKYSHKKSTQYSDQKLEEKAASPPDDWKDRKGNMMSDLNNFG